MRKIPVGIAVLFMAVAGAHAAAVPVGSGSYTDVLPYGKTGPQSAIYISSNVTGPIPTNEWWSSLVASQTPYRLFAYPLAYKCYHDASYTDRDGLLMGLPRMYEQAATAWNGKEELESGDAEANVAPFRQQLLVQGTYNAGATLMRFDKVPVDGYSDWTLRTLWQDKADSTKYFKATFGQGLPFTYFEFGPGVDARIAYPYDWTTRPGSLKMYGANGTVFNVGCSTTTDHVLIEFCYDTTGAKQYYGVFAATGTVFTRSASGYVVSVTLPDGEKYLSIAALPATVVTPAAAVADLPDFYAHAYAFVTDTRVSWNVDTALSRMQTTFNVTTELKRAGKQNTTILALFPHQWKNSNSTYAPPSSIADYATLRGTMTCIAGNSFTVTNYFNGLIPYLPDRGDYDQAHLKELLDDEYAPLFSRDVTYEHGKEISRIADLIPLANQQGRKRTCNSMISALKKDLADWYTYTPGETSRCFYYNSNWGGLIGYGTCYGSENYNDQNFHLGYFVYASALLAMADPSFIQQYGGMTDLLIRSYASPDRHDALFPFLRTFSPYEGHSWADGRGSIADVQANDGNNQESSSEAMNSWAAIYLWGLATGNDTYRDLGIWGFVTEYSATREYYFDVDNDKYGDTYGHGNVGILWGGKAHYSIWFTPQVPETIRGIQMLPVNTSHLYLGYTTSYMAANYAELVSENGGTEDLWQDTIWKYQAMFDPAAALAKYTESITFDDGNSKAFTYHWLHNLNVMGAVDTGVYADQPSYAVFKATGTETYVFFNIDDSTTTARFCRRSDNGLIGSIAAPPRSMVSTTDFSVFKTEFMVSTTSVLSSDLRQVRVYPNPFKPGSGTAYDRAGGMVFSHLTGESKIKIYTIAGELVFEGTENDGDGLFEWNAVNNAGAKVASGVYLYVVSGSGDKARGKLVVIR